MTGSRKLILKHTIETAAIFLFGCLSTFFFCEDCVPAFPRRLPLIIYFGILWAVLWKGNEWVSYLPEKYVSWLERPLARMIIGLLSHVLFTIFVVFVLQLLVELLSNDPLDTFNLKKLLEYSLPSVIITLIIVTLMTAIKFFKSWRNLAVRHEKLKTEAMTSKYAALKNQVNPHFLFNSLNVLSGLVYKDTDLSAQFIRKLAEVYRYVLNTQEKEWVTLREELEFVNSFVFLQKIRFGQHLNLHIKISESNQYKIIPMSLQMLVENAIKHNIISDDHPLTVNIYHENQHIVVSNHKASKTVMTSTEGIGLKNLDSRYQFLISEPVQIVDNDEMFIVKIPLIPV